MSIEVNIRKNLGDFQLELQFLSDSRRIGILGVSGCGKSLTLKCIAGIETPDQGRIAINGKILFDRAARICQKPQQRRVGYLFQNYALFPTMTVEENIAAGLTGDKAFKIQRVRQMVERFQLTGLEKHLPGQLSGGQQQRVALARILAYEPEEILLDEPFSALDGHLRDQMQRELMGMLADYPGTVILVSHSRDEVYRMSQELLILDKGRIVAQGPTKELFQRPGNAVTARLTGCKNIAGAAMRPDGSIYVKDWDIALPLRSGRGDGSDNIPQGGRRDGSDSIPQGGRGDGSDSIPQGVAGVAIRANLFQIQRTEENARLCFPVRDPVVTEDLFEYNISFLASEKASGRIDWKVRKEILRMGEMGLPDKIYLREQDLLLLEDGI